VLIIDRPETLIGVLRSVSPALLELWHIPLIGYAAGSTVKDLTLPVRTSRRVDLIDSQ
jgi:hypothetical protein